MNLTCITRLVPNKINVLTLEGTFAYVYFAVFSCFEQVNLI